MRVGIVSFMQESNTFIVDRTTLADFYADTLLLGSSIRRQFADAKHEIGGFFTGLDAAGIEAVPIFAARAIPFGAVEARGFDQLMKMSSEALKQAGQLDGLLAAAHGATVSENFPDADGFWLACLRKVVGPNIPIIATLDPHANLSRQMVDATDALIAYRTNPHTDQRARGIEAAQLITQTLKGKVRPTQAAAFLPLAINIERQQTDELPCLTWFELADQMRNRPNALSASVILGFPYADVTEMGSATLVVTDNNHSLACTLASELAKHGWEHRHDYVGQLISIEEGLRRAISMRGPVLLLDMGDNVGAGSPADGTALIRAIHEHGLRDAFVCLCDPTSVRQAMAAPVATPLWIEMGGRSDGHPLTALCHVLGVYDGKFNETQPRHGGFSAFDQGPTAVIRTDGGITVMLTSRRTPPFSLCQLTAFGLQPERFHFIVAKGVIAPIAAYKDVCHEIIRVNTPGVTCADLGQFTYRHRRRPMYPFEEGATYEEEKDTTRSL